MVIENPIRPNNTSIYSVYVNILSWECIPDEFRNLYEKWQIISNL